MNISIRKRGLLETRTTTATSWPLQRAPPLVKFTFLREKITKFLAYFTFNF